MLNPVSTHFVWKPLPDSEEGHATFFTGTAQEVTVPMPSLSLALTLGKAISGKLQQAYSLGKSKSLD